MSLFLNAPLPFISGGGDATLGPGAYLSINSNGDALKCNLSIGQTIGAGTTFVTVARASNNTFLPYIYFDDAGSLSTSQAHGVTSSISRMGLFEADKSPNHGRNLNDPLNDVWVMVALKYTSNVYNGSSLLTRDGATGIGGGGAGTGANDSIDDVSNFTVHLGCPTAGFTGTNDFDIAFARIYGAELTEAQSTQIWDHWAERNSVLYTSNGQASPSYTSGVADYTTGMLAEWDFAKMKSSSLQSTAGSLGIAQAQLLGSASIIQP